MYVINSIVKQIYQVLDMLLKKRTCPINDPRPRPHRMLGGRAIPVNPHIDPILIPVPGPRHMTYFWVGGGGGNYYFSIFINCGFINIFRLLSSYLVPRFVGKNIVYIDLNFIT